MPARTGNCALRQAGSRGSYSSTDLSGRHAALRPQLCQPTLATRIWSGRSHRPAVRAAALVICAGRSVSGRGTASQGGAGGGASDGASCRRAARLALPACFRRGAGACTAQAAGGVLGSTSGGGGGGGGGTPAYTSQGDSADGDPHAQLQKVLRRAAPATYSRARQYAVSTSSTSALAPLLGQVPHPHGPAPGALSRGRVGPRSSAWERTSCPRTFRCGPASLPGTS
jgi:hypothetical protein